MSATPISICAFCRKPVSGKGARDPGAECFRACEAGCGDYMCMPCYFDILKRNNLEDGAPVHHRDCPHAISAEEIMLGGFISSAAKPVFVLKTEKSVSTSAPAKPGEAGNSPPDTSLKCALCGCENEPGSAYCGKCYASLPLAQPTLSAKACPDFSASQLPEIGMTRAQLIAVIGEPDPRNTRTWEPHEYIVYYLTELTYEITLKNGVVENIGKKPPMDLAKRVWKQSPMKPQAQSRPREKPNLKGSTAAAQTTPESAPKKPWWKFW